MTRWISLAAAAALIAIVSAGVVFQVSKMPCFNLSGEVVCHVETKRKLVALTFDDGPTAKGLDAVLPVLERHNAKGTFFVIGRQVQAPLVRRILASGNEIGNHSFHHRRMIFRPSAFYRDEIARTDAALRAAGAPTPALFRPPFGKKLIGLPLAVERSGKRMITWDSGDPPVRDPAEYARLVLDQIRPGSIVLIHPMYRHNGTERAALPIIVAGLATRGYRMVTVSELLATNAPPAPAAR